MKGRVKNENMVLPVKRQWGVVWRPIMVSLKTRAPETGSSEKRVSRHRTDQRGRHYFSQLKPGGHKGAIQLCVRTRKVTLCDAHG